MIYDINLMRQLNDEYKDKKIYDYSKIIKTPEWHIKRADGRIDSLIARGADFEGKKILEIGCGPGTVAHRLAQRYDCSIVGVDIDTAQEYEWKKYSSKNVNLLVADITHDNPFKDKKFDYIYSFYEFEHIFHPFEMLRQAANMLKPDGKLFIRANLYRSAIASHLYNVIYFPFPHLLFDHHVISQFAKEQGTSNERINDSALINKLTYAHYKEYFRMLNLEIVSERLIIRNLDFTFYKRFEDKLGLYPIFDLELDVFFVTLMKTSDNSFLRKNILFKNFTITKDDNHYINLEFPQKPIILYITYLYHSLFYKNKCIHNKMIKRIHIFQTILDDF